MDVSEIYYSLMYIVPGITATLWIAICLMKRVIKDLKASSNTTTSGTRNTKREYPPDRLTQARTTGMDEFFKTHPTRNSITVIQIPHYEAPELVCHGCHGKLCGGLNPRGGLHWPPTKLHEWQDCEYCGKPFGFKCYEHHVQTHRVITI